jgi:hypothetical protein
MTQMTFPRPEPTDMDKVQAHAEADALLKKFGMGHLRDMLAYLVLENVMLVRHVNELRVKLNIEPLKTFDV